MKNRILRAWAALYAGVLCLVPAEAFAAGTLSETDQKKKLWSGLIAAAVVIVISFLRYRSRR